MSTAQARSTITTWESWVFPAVSVFLTGAVLYYGLVDDLAPWAVALTSLAVGAGAIASRWPRVSAGMAGALAGAVVLFMPDQYTGAAAGLLLPLAACVIAGHARVVGVVALWTLTLHVVDLFNRTTDPNLLNLLPAIVLDSALIGCAVLIGYAVRTGRRSRRQAATDAIATLRREISRELHDTVAYELSVAALRADICQERGHASATDLEVIAGQCRRAIADMRSVVRLLRADGNDHVRTLVIPTYELIPQRSQRLLDAGFLWSQHIDFDLGELPRPVDETLSRILTEVFNNIERHAEVGQCSLIASWTSQHVEFSVMNPHAARPPVSPQRETYGILGMSERAAAVGGSLTSGGYDTRWMVRVALPAVKPGALR